MMMTSLNYYCGMVYYLDQIFLHIIFLFKDYALDDIITKCV